MTSFAPLQFLEFLVSYSILTQIGGGRVFTICQREPLKPLFAGFGSFGQFCCIWKPTLFALATYSSGISIRSETPERKIFSSSFEPLQSFLAALSGNKTEERSGGRFRVVKQALLLLLDYYYYYYKKKWQLQSSATAVLNARPLPLHVPTPFLCVNRNIWD